MAAGAEISQPVSAIAEKNLTNTNKGTGKVATVEMHIGSIRISQTVILEEPEEFLKESEPKDGSPLGLFEEVSAGKGSSNEATPCGGKPPAPRGLSRGFSEASLTGITLGLERSRGGHLENSSSSSGIERIPKVVDETRTFVPILRSGRWTDIGGRSYMEDFHVLIDDLTDFLARELMLARPRAFYGVFDGHGGKAAADFASEHLLQHIVEDPAFPDEQAFRRGFQRTDMALERAWASGSCQCDSGTTALTVLVCGNSLVVANAGDCRAVLSRKGKAVDLSNDQKPSSPAERARIEAAGGFVEDEYLNGQLGVARALGDWHMQGLKNSDPSRSSPSPLTSEPEVSEATLTADDEFMILGCDGLWDVFTSQNAIEYARRRLQQHNDPEQCSRELVAEALRRQTSDNLTVVTVCFGEDPPPKLTTAWRPGVRRSISSNGLLSVQRTLDKC